MHKKRNKIIIGVIAGIAVVGLGGYGILNQRMDGMLGASVATIGKTKESTSGSNDSSSSARAAIRRGYMLDWNSDQFPGTSPDFELEATIDSNDDPKSVKVWFEYNTRSNFSLLTQKIVDLNKFTTVQGNRVSVTKHSDGKKVFNPDTTYYGRYVVLTNRGFTRYEVPPFTTPLECTVTVSPVSIGNTVKKGEQTIAKMNVTNNCNKEVSLSKMEIGIFGLHLSNPNGVGRVSNLKILSSDGKLINSYSEKTSGEWIDFKNEKIPAGQTKQFEIKATVPSNVQINETLLTRVELRGPSLKNPDYSQSINPNTRTSDGKVPSPVVDSQTIWQLKVVQ